MTFTARPSRTLAGICAAAAVSMAAVPGAQAEDGFGYTDVRLTIGTMPWDGYSGGPAYNQGSDDFDSAYRISVMAVGPICGILPIGCETPARLSYESSSGSDDDYGTYDDLGLESNYTAYQDASGYDVLIGFELSGNFMSTDGEINPLSGIYGQAFSNPLQYSLFNFGAGFGGPGTLLAFGAGTPEIDVTAVALTVHVGWGFEVPTRASGRWHWEITPFIGAGLASVDWTDSLSGDVSDDEGMYWEIGARVGTYYTFANGIQIGIDGRYIHGEAEVENFGNASVGVNSLAIAAVLGYRF